MLTEMYSLPKYEEVDPTPAMMPFYLVFWYDGSGYWLWLTDATLVYYCFESICFTERHETFCRLFLDFIISNNYLGLHLRFVFGAALPPIMFGIKSPFPILSTTEDVNTILILSVIFGFIQLVVGLMINGIQLSKQKRYLDSINESYAWLGILFGLALLVVGKLVVKMKAYLQQVRF